MKYIKTKDGIYKFPKGFTEFKWNKKTLLENKEHIVWTGGEVIAKADIIDELCDLFMADKGYKMFYARENGFRTLDDIRQNCGLENCKYLYAYIYGEDGDIIKVAKMNKEGNLCLL